MFARVLCLVHVKLQREFFKDPLENHDRIAWKHCQPPTFVQFLILYRLTFERAFYHLPELRYFKCKKRDILELWSKKNKLKFLC